MELWLTKSLNMELWLTSFKYLCILFPCYESHHWDALLINALQDGYVPYHSARIELCQASSGDYSKRGKIFLEMLNDCLDQIRTPSCEHRVFMRCDVNFDTSSQGRNLNTIIGRAAHIEFLETDIFARFIMWSFPELFRWVWWLPSRFLLLCPSSSILFSVVRNPEQWIVGGAGLGCPVSGNNCSGRPDA